MNNYSTFETIKRRRSIRHYSHKPVEESKIIQVLEAARLAPSSSNTQPWHFIVVQKPDTIRKLSDCVPIGSKIFINEFVKSAPVIIVACGIPKTRNHLITKFFGLSLLAIDVAIAIEHMVLAATELDLGTCWVGWFSEKKLKMLLRIPRNVRIISLLTLGYPEKTSTHKDLGGIKAKPRKALSEIYSLEFFGNRFK